MGSLKRSRFVSLKWCLVTYFVESVQQAGILMFSRRTSLQATPILEGLAKVAKPTSCYPQILSATVPNDIDSHIFQGEVVDMELFDCQTRLICPFFLFFLMPILDTLDFEVRFEPTDCYLGLFQGTIILALLLLCHYHPFYSFYSGEGRVS